MQTFSPKEKLNSSLMGNEQSTQSMIFDTKEECDKMYATIVRLAGSDNDIQCGKQNGKYVITTAPIHGDAFKKLLPPKPSLDYGEATVVPQGLQTNVNDWFHIVNTERKIIIETTLRRPIGPSGFKSFERALVLCPDVTHMLYLPNICRMIVGMEKAMVAIDLEADKWTNITPGIVIHLENGVMYGDLRFFTEEFRTWKEKNFEGPLFEKYVGYHDNPKLVECDCSNCVRKRRDEALSKNTKIKDEKQKDEHQDDIEEIDCSDEIPPLEDNK